MKKIMVVLLVSAMAASLAGCSDSVASTGNSDGGQNSYRSNVSTQQYSSKEPVEETYVTDRKWKWQEFDGTYTGEVKNNRPNGKGIYQSTGDEYVVVDGYWKDGKINGNAKELYVDYSAEGKYIDDILVEGKVETRDGEYYNGRFEDRQLVEGEMIRSNGTHLKGIFKNWGLVSGTKQYTASGDGTLITEEGEFDGGERLSSGIRVEVYTDGTLLELQGTFGYDSSGKWIPVNSTWIEYDWNGKVTKKGNFKNGKYYSGGQQVVGEIISGIGEWISDGHPITGKLLDIFGKKISGD